MIDIKYRKPTPAHLAFREALTKAIESAGQGLLAEELLAISSNFVGVLTALQDQRIYTSAMVMKIC